MMEKKKTISLVSSSPVQAPLQCTRRLYFDGPGSFWRNTDFESDSPGISTKLQGLPSKNSTFWQLVKVTWRGTWMNYQQNNKERISRNEKSLPDAFQKKMVRPSNREDFAFILEIVEERHISNFLSKSFFLVNGITWRCWEQPWDELVHLNEFIATLVDFPDQPPGVFELPDANSTQYPKIPRSPPWRSAKITCKTRHLLPFPSSSFTTMPFVAPTQSSSTEKKNQGSGQKRLLPSHQVAMCHLPKCRIFRRVLGCSAWPLPSPWRILMPRRSTKTRLPERYWSGEPKRNFRHCPHSPHKTPGLQVSVSMCETSRLLTFFWKLQKKQLSIYKSMGSSILCNKSYKMSTFLFWKQETDLSKQTLGTVLSPYVPSGTGGWW